MLKFASIKKLLLSGITIADNNTPIDGGFTIGIGYGNHITLIESSPESLIVADVSNKRILQILDIGSDNYNVSILAQN